MTRIVVALTLLVATQITAQTVTSERIAELHAVLTARVRTEKDVTHRTEKARAWLDTARYLKGPPLGFLRILAGYHATDDKGERRTCLDELASYLEENASRLPAPEFRKVVGSMMLWYGVALTDDGKFAAAKRELATILAFQGDRRSAFWLMGRRGRDHGSAAGRAYLQDTIIPAILTDHALDDVDRIFLLRRLYTVDYTGPRPFNHISGPTVAGGRAASKDLEGNVALVMYWATW